MKYLALSLLVLVSVYSVSANQKCTGWPRKYKGKSCASTTNYHDSHKGACGCGPASGDNQFGWNAGSFVAAASQLYFDGGHKGWCGEHCGQCIKLTTTGGYVPGQGGPVAEGLSKTFMITNLCPNIYPNQDWCSQGSQFGGHNKYGYELHLDLENGRNQVRGMGWNNPETTWEVVNCNNEHGHDGRTPSYGMWGQCQCAHQGKRGLNETDNGSL